VDGDASLSSLLVHNSRISGRRAQFAGWVRRVVWCDTAPGLCRGRKSPDSDGHVRPGGSHRLSARRRRRRSGHTQKRSDEATETSVTQEIREITASRPARRARRVRARLSLSRRDARDGCDCSVALEAARTAVALPQSDAHGVPYWAGPNVSRSAAGACAGTTGLSGSTARIRW
jgi:hypothetical protein